MSENVVHALAGAGGGMISMFLTYPLNTISQRLQVQHKDVDTPDLNYIQLLQRILKEEGVLGFYSGLDSALFGIALTNGVYYYFYECSRSAFKSVSNKALSTVELMASGALAGAATTFITNPIWVVNTRIATKKNQINNSSILDEESARNLTNQTNSISTFKAIVKEDGLTALWQGFGAALVLVSNPIIQYTVYEKLKTLLETRKQKLNNLDVFVIGAIAKLAATVLTYPYLVIKSRMQLKKSDDEQKRYTSVLDGFKKILKNEGIKGFYNGISSKILQSVLNAAFMFTSKELLFKYTLQLLLMLSPFIRNNRRMK